MPRGRWTCCWDSCRSIHSNWCRSSMTRPRRWPRSTMSSRSRRAAMMSSARRSTSCSARCTGSRVRPRRSAWPRSRSRAHAFEDLLKELRERPQLSGNDFLPLVVSLDDILGHLQSIRELVSRADALRATALLTRRPAREPRRRRRATCPSWTWRAPLDALAQRIAADLGKKVRLVATGLDEVPAETAQGSA